MLKLAKLMLVFALAFVMLFGSTAAGAKSDSDAIVSIAVDQEFFAANQEVVVHVTISNPTNHTIKVLKWYTPVEEVEEPLFTVLRDGAPVQYLGAIYKRPAPTGADYVSLKAGESITSNVALSAYYDLSVSGNYEIVYQAASWNLSDEKAEKSKGIESMTSNALKVAVEGRQSAQVVDITPLAVTGGTTYNRCTTSQQSSLVSARNQASTYLANAVSYLQANTQGPRYTTWFGIITSSRYNAVTQHFGAIRNAMDTASMKFDCSCKKRYYAYVYPTQPYTIYICSVFWNAPLTGTDSKAGTLIHETSHFNVVVGTDDYVYGQSGAKSLAISNPDQAIMNADNHEYFAENTPSQP